jgi:hypothetical protein
MAADHEKDRRREALEVLRGVVRQLLGRVRSLQIAVDRTTDELLQIRDALDTFARAGVGVGLPVRTTRPPRKRWGAVSWFATKAVPSTSGLSTFVVGERKHAVKLTKLQAQLVSVLMTGAPGADGLPAFLSIDSIARRLEDKDTRRAPTRRSVVVGIARLRRRLEAIGDLVEGRPGEGYRLRFRPPQ